MKYFRWFLAILLVGCLVLVRKFETQLFYDPILDYFHGNYMNQAFPTIDFAKHILNVSSRYLLNSILSLGIIYLLFNEIKFVKISAVVMFLLFLPLILLYIYFIKTEFETAVTAGFYVRRFLLQPIILLLLVPAIWFYKKRYSEL